MFLNQRRLSSALLHQASSFDLYIQTYQDLRFCVLGCRDVVPSKVLHVCVCTILAILDPRQHGGIPNAPEDESLTTAKMTTTRMRNTLKKQVTPWDIDWLSDMVKIPLPA